MPVFVIRKGVMVPIEEAEPLIQVFGEAPYVIGDAMPATRHMCDGNYYTSKAQFRDVTKAHGCVEVGNEASTLLKPRKPIQLSKEKRVNDIKRAIHDLKQAQPKRRRRK